MVAYDRKGYWFNAENKAVTWFEWTDDNGNYFIDRTRMERVRKIADAAITALQTEFVKNVRQSGGRNLLRCLLVTTAEASTAESAIRGLEVPKDRQVMVSLHPYLPHDFCYCPDDGEGLTSWDGSGRAVGYQMSLVG